MTTDESSHVACMRVSVCMCMCGDLHGLPEQYVAVRWMTSANDASSESGTDRLMEHVTVHGLVTMPVCSSFYRPFLIVFGPLIKDSFYWLEDIVYL